MIRPLIIGVAGFGAVAASQLAAGEEHQHWSYSGKSGPSHWAELDAKNGACGVGKSQSPIEIQTSQAHRGVLPALSFDYRDSPLHIVDNGHSIQINVEPGSVLKIADKSYQLVQFHFHHPSEERVDGKASDMVAHLVHRDSAGALAVVAVLFNRGKPNEVIETLWKHLPKQKDQELDLAKLRINPAGLLPNDHGYFTYTGSLTTPPCTEGVRWIVLKSPSTLSKREIATFAGRYPNDARPLQQLNGREVLASQ